MRVLIVSKSKIHEDNIRNQLTDICEGNSLIFHYSFEEAKNFLTNHIIKHQVPLDLIIAFSSVQSESSNYLRDWIRNDFQRTYSKRDFNFCEIPIALIVDASQNRNAFNNYDVTISNIGIDKLHLFTTEFASCIKTWRKKVLDELDSLGIRFNSGSIDYSYYLQRNNKKNTSTTILSENFKKFPRRLDYYWLEFNKKQIEQSIDQFIKMLKRSRRIGKKGEEKKYHQFFNKNEFFLLRDEFSRFWYEPKLMKNSSQYEEPDYSLRPNFNYQTDLSLLEVKLPK